LILKLSTLFGAIDKGDCFMKMDMNKTKLADRVFKSSEIYAIDLVCGMTIEQSQAKRHNYHGRKYFFCSNLCKTHFRDNPVMYAEVL
jgi:YHS domain-containing protein